jgi:acetylornithine deacetylase/succinyl-diaminopimelate desuccinylase-like protein
MHPAAQVRAVMPHLLADLDHLVKIPSTAFPGFPPGPVHDLATATVEVLRRAGADTARLIDVPGGYPAVYANLPGPPGTPTVLLYAHYDVHPPDGRDTRGIAVHAGTVRAFRGRPPVGVRILIEGEEATVSDLPGFLLRHPRLVDCDTLVISGAGGPIMATVRELHPEAGIVLWANDSVDPAELERCLLAQVLLLREHI